MISFNDAYYVWTVTYLWRKHHIVAGALGPAGQLAHVPRQDAGILGNPFHECFDAFHIRLITIFGLTLLMTKRFT